MKKIFNFVYITTNLVNGKQYIGDHSTNDLNCYTTKIYFGSGIAIKEAIKKYGKQNFKKDILEFFDTKENAFNSQEKYIKLYKTHVSQDGYNISWKGGHQTNESVSDETRNKMKKSHIGKKQSAETIDKRVKKITGKKRTKEQLKTMSEAQKITQNKPEVIEKKKKSRTGILHTEENKKLMSINASINMKKWWDKRKQKL
jgi:group I intron endonuclease